MHALHDDHDSGPLLVVQTIECAFAETAGGVGPLYLGFRCVYGVWIVQDQPVAALRCERSESDSFTGPSIGISKRCFPGAGELDLWPQRLKPFRKDQIANLARIALHRTIIE